MSSVPDELASFDVVIVGSGVAGLSVALACEEAAVLLVTKGQIGVNTASEWAQGGIAAAVGPGDSVDRHAADTLKVGQGLCEPALVELLTREGPARIGALLAYGARFDRNRNGELELTREAAHSVRRILHWNGDQTGREIVRALKEALWAHTNISFLEDAFAEDLLVDGPTVTGVRVRTGTRRLVVSSPRIVLAAGGAGQLFLHTTNPAPATGDGIAMAGRAGARLADLEFVQFHPTALKTSDPMPLLTEAIRGEGAVLKDSRNRRFMSGIHPDAELAPRDVVARAIWRLEQEGDRAFLDATEAIGKAFEDRFPTAFRHCIQRGIDPAQDPIPVSPAAHYLIGGVATDQNGRTSLPGLWACGEVAAGGVHGANRLASNSLLEGLVFGSRVGLDLVHSSVLYRPAGNRHSLPMEEPERSRTVRNRLRRLMWEKVGLVRDEDGLEQALSRIQELAEVLGPGSGETSNLLYVANRVAAAALKRRESRGVHFRSDFEKPSPEFRQRMLQERDDSERLSKVGS